MGIKDHEEQKHRWGNISVIHQTSNQEKREKKEEKETRETNDKNSPEQNNIKIQGRINEKKIPQQGII